MELSRCRDQNTKTLDEFYREFAESPEREWADIGRVMLDVIAHLRALPTPSRAYGLTSLYRLCLLAEDTYKSPWFIIISAPDERNIDIEYLMPAHLAHWPNAYVKGCARSIDEAVEMIVIGMEKSEGWKS